MMIIGLLIGWSARASSAGREGPGAGGPRPARAARPDARHVSSGRRPLPDHAGGARGAAPAPVRRGSLGRPVPQEGGPPGPVEPPVHLPQPRRGRPAVRPRTRWAPTAPGGEGRTATSRPRTARGDAPAHRARLHVHRAHVVMAIIALAAAVVVPTIDAGIDSREVRRATRQIAATMHHSAAKRSRPAGPPQETSTPRRTPSRPTATAAGRC